MRYFYQSLMLSTALLVSSQANALGFFLEGLDWRATETNDWAYINSETLPNQTLDYKTIDFPYQPGFRLGLFYINSNVPCHWDAMLAYTHLYTSANDAAVGHIQPSFLGSVTAKPSHAYLYDSGQVHQRLRFNMIEANVGKQFHPASIITIHPFTGLIGGWIDQSINAQYQGSLSTQEKITNNFKGLGPKVGLDADVSLFDGYCYQPKLFASFATAYLVGHWDISDVALTSTSQRYYVEGDSSNMGSFMLQGAIGLKLDYQQLSVKLAYEMSDWFDQVLTFDNDTGAHNNDLVLQGLSLGFSFNFA